MCELFALSSLHPATVRLSFEEFSRHGGLAGPHKDGWGIVFYDGRDVRLALARRSLIGRVPPFLSGAVGGCLTPWGGGLTLCGTGFKPVSLLSC